MSRRQAAFLDRDGVLNRRPLEHEYVRSVDDLHLLRGAPEAVRLLAASGYVPVVVSNQRGMARGKVTWGALREIELAIIGHVSVPVHFYYCPHDSSDGCDCRKPLPGMLLRAAADLRLDLPRSTTIGDSESDVAAGQAAGTRTIRIAPDGTETAADLLASTLSAAVARLLHCGNLARGM